MVLPYPGFHRRNGASLHDLFKARALIVEGKDPAMAGFCPFAIPSVGVRIVGRKPALCQDRLPMVGRNGLWPGAPAGHVCQRIAIHRRQIGVVGRLDGR